MYRDPIKGMQILLSRTKAGPGRTGKEEQEQISLNHVQTIFGSSVFLSVSRRFLRALPDSAHSSIARMRKRKRVLLGGLGGTCMVARWLQPDFLIVCVLPFGLLNYGSATLRCKI